MEGIETASRVLGSRTAGTHPVRDGEGYQRSSIALDPSQIYSGGHGDWLSLAIARGRCQSPQASRIDPTVRPRAPPLAFSPLEHVVVRQTGAGEQYVPVR